MPPTRWSLPPRGLRKGFAGLMNAYNGQRVGAATVALGLAAGAYELALAYARSASSSAGRSPSSRACSGCWPTCRPSSRRRSALIYKAAAGAGDGFPDPTAGGAGQDLRLRDGDQGDQRRAAALRRRGLLAQPPLERMVRDARMFTIGGGTAQILRTGRRSRLLGRKAAADPRRLPRAAARPSEN